MDPRRGRTRHRRARLVRRGRTRGSRSAAAVSPATNRRFPQRRWRTPGAAVSWPTFHTACSALPRRVSLPTRGGARPPAVHAACRRRLDQLATMPSDACTTKPENPRVAQRFSGLRSAASRQRSAVSSSAAGTGGLGYREQRSPLTGGLRGAERRRLIAESLRRSRAAPPATRCLNRLPDQFISAAASSWAAIALADSLESVTAFIRQADRPTAPARPECAGSTSRRSAWASIRSCG